MLRRPSIPAPNSTVGYVDGRTLIAHNTFVFARWNDEPTNDGWESESRSSTVAIIDVVNPLTGTGQADPDSQLRGIGHPCVVGNLFRTRPVSSGTFPKPFAMLGVKDADTLVSDGATLVQTNAFDPARVGSTNGNGSNGSGFFSVPVQTSLVETGATNGNMDLWNCSLYNQFQTPASCTAATAPQDPAMAVWDGTAGLDPAFVGEYLATTFVSTHSQLATYQDWRILPGSPLENLGVLPASGGPRVYQTGSFATTGFTYPLVVVPEVDFLQWDGEHWGNPRVVDSSPDVGFDERHLLIQAGNWSNDSNSHNQPGYLHPGIPAAISTRFFILPDNAGGVSLNVANRSLRVFQVQQTPNSPSTGNAWVNPPQSLATPVSAAGLPLFYRTKYIAFTQALAWADQALGTGASVTFQPLLGVSGQSLTFSQVTQVDDECSPTPCTHSFFNLQSVVLETSSTTVLLRSNMQGEYR
jgi:hypothetical protein